MYYSRSNELPKTSKQADRARKSKHQARQLKRPLVKLCNFAVLSVQLLPAGSCRDAKILILVPFTLGGLITQKYFWDSSTIGCSRTAGLIVSDEIDDLLRNNFLVEFW
jgi:hypothetical protein